MRRHSTRIVYFWALLAGGFSTVLFTGKFAQGASSRTLTILHTNDIHSHYRAEPQPPYLGGIARMKTLINQLRSQNSNSLLLDGGDWTEGQIYYNLGAGIASYQMMEHLGYDAVVLGNHDFLNGPEATLNAILKSGLKAPVIATNLDATDFSKAAELKEHVPSFYIKEVGGLKIGFLGLTTYEFIYDSFIKPVRILSSFEAAQTMAKKLKQDLKVDIVIAISHNNLTMNRKILEIAPEIDVMIGAHDHKKTVQPIFVSRKGREKGILVETGSWGRYLGDLRITITDTGAVRFESYELHPVHNQIEEDRDTLALIEQFEKTLEKNYGDIFHDHVADSEIPLEKDGPESPLGGLITDAFRLKAGTAVALDHGPFIHGSLKAGSLSTADIRNILPSVYSPETGKSWTLKTLSMKGSTLQWLFTLLLSPQKMVDGKLPSFSGMEIVYEPAFKTREPFQKWINSPQDWIESDPTPIIRSMTIGGSAVEGEKEYSVAYSGGIHHTLSFISGLLPGIFKLEKEKETGIEAWQALRDHLESMSPLTGAKLGYGKRLRSLAADLTVLPWDIEAHPTGESIYAKITVRNLGNTPSTIQKSSLLIQGHRPGSDPLVQVNPVLLTPPLTIPVLGIDEFKTFEVTIPFKKTDDAYFPVLISIKSETRDASLGNNQVLRWIPLQAQ